MDLINFDYETFRLFNGFAGISHNLDLLFIILAEGVLFLMIAGIFLYGLLKKSRKEGIRIIIQAYAAAFFSRAIIIPIIRVFFFRERPFVAGIVNQLVSHNPAEASFPSGHAGLMFAMALSLFFFDKKWGTVFLALATISSLSRIVVGVHFPLDIVGGFLVAVFCSFIIKWLFNWWFRSHSRRF